MEKKVCLNLIILTILGLILAIGFGCGNDNVVSPSSTNQDNNGNVLEGYGYITMEITWPQTGMDGKLTLSSGNDESSVVASAIPPDANTIEVRICEKDKDWDNYLPEGQHIFLKHEDKNYTFGPLPAIEVTIRIRAWNEAGQQILEQDEPYTINPGWNLHAIPLHAQTLSVWPNPASVAIGGTTTRMSIPPTPIVPAESIITAQIKMSVPTPSPTPLSGSGSVEGNTIQSQATDLSGYEIKFSIASGPGMLYLADESASGTTVTDYTDTDGYCDIKLKAAQPGIVDIISECMVVPGDPNTLLTASCQVTVTGGSGGEGYSMTVSAFPDKIEIIPDFSSPDPIAYPYFDSSNITATLTKNGEPAENESINFTIVDGYGASLSLPAPITDESGSTSVDLIADSLTVDDRDVTVLCEFINPDDPNEVISQEAVVTITSHSARGDDFERYYADTRADELHNWNTGWWAYGDATDAATRDMSYIDTMGALDTAQSLRLFAEDEPYHYAKASKTMGFWSNTFGEYRQVSSEFRFNFMVDDLSGDDVTKAFAGLYGQGYGNFMLIEFKDNGHIYDCNGEEIDFIYTKNEWHSLRIEIWGKNATYTPQARLKINYYINGVWRQETYLENTQSLYGDREVWFQAEKGNVWFDEMEFYPVNHSLP